jgi:hypothetical protein
MQRVALAYRCDGSRSVVTVSDMSFSGVQIEGASFANDEELTLVIPERGDIGARIRWSGPNAAGARFDDKAVMTSVLPARDHQAFRRVRSFNFGSGRVFGRRSVSA